MGGLFAAFREALAIGGETIGETRAGDPFSFTLDNSVNSVRFTAIAKDDLGPNAHLVLTAPNGETVELKDSGSSVANSTDVSWEAESSPVKMADGSLNLQQGGIGRVSGRFSSKELILQRLMDAYSTQWRSSLTSSLCSVAVIRRQVHLTFAMISS